MLGHICSKEGRTPDPSLVAAITKLKSPHDVAGVRSLLGLAQVAREYIPGLAVLLEPIQRLVKKGVGNITSAWESDPLCTEAFENLKSILTTSPILQIANPSQQYRIHVDACRVGRGLGAILLQLSANNEWLPVAYWSRGLTAAERNYSATELECMALHDAILHWHVYLANAIPFDVITDHYALVYMVVKPGGM